MGHISLFIMLYKKLGTPEENELVLCTVTSVHYNGVFCKLDEYGDSGMIHISEVSPGRIRNIRDYVSEGKKVVCKILRLDKEKGHIDLSLRRVTESQRRDKNAEIKQELKAEKLIEYYASQEKKPVDKTYQEIAGPILKEYEYVFEAFDDVVSGELELEKIKVPAIHAKKMTELIKEKILPKKVMINGIILLTTFEEEGIELIKDLLNQAIKVDKERIIIKYSGNSQYRISVTADDYDEAERLLSEALSKLEPKNSMTTFKFEREE